MHRPDPATARHRRLVILHIPTVVITTVWVHLVAGLVNGLTLLAMASLVAAVLLMLRDVLSQEVPA
ncbi:hypothetical protein [Nesterenkonia rhizosphaerae]|uniref:Uncharacterized protein n=1 Tax=Nesterenkonia rhizosphaerae TaxID=1348272 RepID=A0ABP9G5Z3_9MICC